MSIPCEGHPCGASPRRDQATSSPWSNHQQQGGGGQWNGEHRSAFPRQDHPSTAAGELDQDENAPRLAGGNQNFHPPSSFNYYYGSGCVQNQNRCPPSIHDGRIGVVTSPPPPPPPHDHSVHHRARQLRHDFHEKYLQELEAEDQECTERLQYIEQSLQYYQEELEQVGNRQADIREKAEVTYRELMETEPTVDSLPGALEEHREVLAPIQGTSARSNFTTRRPPMPHQYPHQQNNGLPPPPRHHPSVPPAIAQVWLQDEDNPKNQVCYSDSSTTSYNRHHLMKDRPLQSIREHFGIATEELVEQLQGPQLRDILVDLRDGGFEYNDYRTQPSKRNAIVLLGNKTIAERQEYVIELLEYRT
jgi:hypothetical protein